MATARVEKVYPKGHGPSPAGRVRASCLAATLLALLPGSASAHTSERAFVLTLPTELTITGGTIVVAVSFLLLALIPIRSLDACALDRIGLPLGRIPQGLGTALSLAVLVLALVLIAAGRLGTQDPLANPLPLTVWTLWWSGLTIACVLFGDLWSFLNPWRGLAGLIGPNRPPFAYPAWLGYAPAILGLLAFAWFELIFTAPRSPEILANVVALYLVASLAGTLAFGRDAWLGRAETFSVFFRMVAWLSPLNGRPEGDRPVLTVPGLGLFQLGPLPLSGAAFVLLALATVSFDGLASTFWWLARIGVNPLDFPGRTAVALPNSLLMIAVFAALVGAYGLAVWLGHRLAGRPGPLAKSLGTYVVSIVPIAVGYHIAHYLTVFLVDVQFAAIAFNDPFGRGWDLLGLAGAHASTGFLFDFHWVSAIWHGQVAIIVIAHVIAVAVAHLQAIRRIGRHRTAVLSLTPLTLLMIAYTLFGLWLLSTPTAG